MADLTSPPWTKSTSQCQRGPVAGCCPMGCGATLVHRPDGFVGCGASTCPAPDAVAEILCDWETEHVVQLDESSFKVRHPLRERMGDALMECDVDRQIAAMSGPPRAPGRYRVEVVSGRRFSTWVWTPVVS